MGLPVSSAAAAKIEYIDIILKLKSSLTALLNGNYFFGYTSKYRLDLSNQRTAGIIGHDYNIDNAVKTPVGHNGDNDDDCASLSLEKDLDPIFIRSSLQRLYQQYNIAINKDKYILLKDKITELVPRYKGNELPGLISSPSLSKSIWRHYFNGPS
ncbi:hypothetical protein BGX27_002147 [Mortierella sp. AM989]|nr:hypothetical protein BGX27_002147 [Mortierella sp. AM989]